MAEAGAPAALCLNVRQIYIRGALYQSFFPDGIYTAGDVSVIQNDILFAKSAGFDLLRVHIKIDDPLLFYYADTLGILRRHGKLSAYISTELHDVEWERNGFLNYDRTPKSFGYDPTIINHGDVLPIDAPPIRLCQPGENVILEVMSSHFCRRKRTDVTLHWRLSGIDSIGWVHNDLTSGSAPIPFTHHRVELAQRLAAQPGGIVDARVLAPQLLPGGLSETTTSTIAGAESPATALALLLASPEFLRR